MARIGICTQCGTLGKPKTVTRGSIVIEIALWLCLLVPGLIYSIWRLSTRGPTCRACGAANSLVPPDSPRGRQLCTELPPPTQPSLGEPPAPPRSDPWTN